MARKIGDFIRAQYREHGVENFSKLQQDSHILKSSISSSSRICFLPIRIDFVDERHLFETGKLHKNKSKKKKNVKISDKVMDSGTEFYLMFDI